MKSEKPSIPTHEVSRSDQKGNSCGKEAIPADGEIVVELLVSGEELDAVNITIVLDFAVDLINEEGLHGIVELVFPEVATNISHCEVRPVGVLDSMKEAVVLSDPQAILEGLKVDSGVERIS
jgi:hypothetical protein